MHAGLYLMHSCLLTSNQIDKADQRGCQQRSQAIFNWYTQADGKASAGSKEFLGQRATLKYRHFKEHVSIQSK